MEARDKFNGAAKINPVLHNEGDYIKGIVFRHVLYQ